MTTEDGDKPIAVAENPAEGSELEEIEASDTALLHSDFDVAVSEVVSRQEIAAAVFDEEQTILSQASSTEEFIGIENETIPIELVASIQGIEKLFEEIDVIDIKEFPSLILKIKILADEAKKLLKKSEDGLQASGGELLGIESEIKKKTTTLSEENEKDFWGKLFRIGERSSLKKAIKDLKVKEGKISTIKDDQLGRKTDAEKLLRKVEKYLDDTIVKLVTKIFQSLKAETEKTREKMTDPRLRAGMNEQLVDSEFLPLFEQLKLEGKYFSDEEISFYLQHRKEIARDGIQDTYSMSAEDREAYEAKFDQIRKLEERSGYKLYWKSTALSLDPDRGSTPDERYDDIFKLLTEIGLRQKVDAVLDLVGDLGISTEAKTKIYTETKKEFLEYYYSYQDLDKRPDIQVYADFCEMPGELGRWQTTRDICIESGLIDEATFHQAEEILIDYLQQKYLSKKGGEPDTQVEQVFNLGNPGVIPVLYQFVVLHGSHSGERAMRRLLTLIDEKYSHEEVLQSTKDLPGDDQKIFELLLDKDSCLNRFARESYLWTMFGYLGDPKKTLRNEAYTQKLLDSGYPEDKAAEFFTGRWWGKDLLIGCVEIAEVLGIDKEIIIEDYFKDITRSVYLESPDSLEIIGLVAKELGVPALEIYHRIESEMVRSKEDKQSVHSPQGIIESCRVLSDITGESLKAVVDRYYPIKAIPTYQEKYAEIFEELAQILEVPVGSLVLENLLPQLSSKRGDRGGLYIVNSKDKRNFLFNSVSSFLQTNPVLSSTEDYCKIFNLFDELNKDWLGSDFEKFSDEEKEKINSGKVDLARSFGEILAKGGNREEIIRAIRAFAPVISLDDSKYAEIFTLLAETMEMAPESLVSETLIFDEKLGLILPKIKKSDSRCLIGKALFELAKTDRVLSSAKEIKKVFNALSALQLIGAEEDPSDEEIKVIFETKEYLIGYVREKMKNDPNKIDIIGTLISLKSVTFQDLLLFSSFREEFPDSQTFEKIFSDGLIAIDPNLQEIFDNPRKLGTMRPQIISKIIDYIEEAYKGEEIDNEKIAKELLSLLNNIRHIFESSDSTIIEKRSLFLEKYTLEDAKDPDFKIAVESLMEQGLSLHEAIKQLVQGDFEDILIASGSIDMQKHYKKKLKDPNISEEDRLDLEKKLKWMKEAYLQADQRNREIFQRLQRGGLTEEERAEIACPLATSVSQVGPPDVTYPILDQGTLCDALLGEIAKDQENNLGAHISKTSRVPGDRSTLAGRLPSYGNPHGTQVNRIYGDVSANKYQSYGPDGTAETHFQMGPAHQCIMLGLPSTEISAIVISDTSFLADQKKYIAMKNLFIPILDSSGNNLWTPEEFDQMKIFYYALNYKGYPLAVIDNVYKYYLELNQTTEKTKHNIVLNKAVDLVKKQIENDEQGFEDLAVLVDFLKSNDLNTKDIQWYEEADFEQVMQMVEENVGAKNRWKARDILFIYPDDQAKTHRTIGDSVDYERQITRRPHGFIDSFLDDQLGYISPGNIDERRAAEGHLTSLMFRDSISRQAREGIIVDDVIETAEYMTEKKKELMVKIWEDAWEDILKMDSIDKAMAGLYKKAIIPVVTGSGGRGEITLGSDLDYSLLVDDDHLLEILPERTDLAQFIKDLGNFVNNVLAISINKSLGEAGIRADAGLARKDRQPFSLISRIRQFEINPSQGRQEEEPTEIISNYPLFAEHQGIVAKCKEDLIVHNQSAHLLDSYILRDLETGFGKASFTAEFEKLYACAASGELLQKIKESLQRSLVFKINYLLFSAFDKGTIDPSEASKIPSGTIDTINFLKDHKILTDQEAEICIELWAITYKIRFLGEVFSPEGQNADELKKVKNITFKLDDISFAERVRLFDLLKLFKDNVLYK